MLPSKLKTRGHRMEGHNDHTKPDLSVMWSSVILLLIVAGTMVFLFTSRSILSDPCHQSEVISLKGRNISSTYLEAIDNYFTDTTSPVTVYTPHSHEAALEEHLWHFGATEETGGEVTAAVFTSSDVRYLQLVLESKQTTITIAYSLNCSSQSHKVQGTKCSHMRRMMPHDRNTIVADVSNDVQPWLSGDWKLTIKTAKWKNSNNYYKEEHKMQPALCIQHRRSRTAEESPLQNILKSFLVNRINERMTQIPIQYQGEDERQLKRKQRSTPLECQMYKLEMNLDDLGLARVVLPTQVYLTYCRGTCLMLDDPALFTVNALVRAKYTFLFGNDKVPSPECVPTHFRPLPFFVQLGDQISRVTFEDLDATKCGCR